MQTIIIKYFEAAQEEAGPLTLLGQEEFHDIDEAMVPNTEKFDRLFFVKKFSGHDVRRWHVISSEKVSAVGASPIEQQVVLKEVKSRQPEVWLPETLKRHSTRVGALLRRGAFVEVDYGFHPSVVNAEGNIGSNKCYTDSVQLGGMPKRRLAIVIQARGNGVQVVPVSSKDPENQQSCFEIDNESLADMVTYTKQCWAIGHMVESVSIHRILPPETFKVTGRGKEYGRNTNYGSGLTHDDRKKLDVALLHAVGQGAYVLYEAQLGETRQEFTAKNQEVKALKKDAHVKGRHINELETRLETQAGLLADLRQALARAAVVEEVAREYVEAFGDNFQQVLMERLEPVN